MADIRNTITLVDKTSSVLDAIQGRIDRMNSSWRALDSVVSRGGMNAALKQMDVSTQSLAASFNAVSAVMNRSVSEAVSLSLSLEEAAKAAQKLKEELNEISGGSSGGGGAQQISNTLVQGSDLFLTNINSAVQLLDRAANELGKVFDTIDNARSTMSRLEIFGGDGVDGYAAYQALYAVAQDTRSSIDQTANLVSRTLVSNVFDNEQALEQSLRLAQLVNKSLVASGATVKQAASGTEQLLQGLGAGQLYWQDLRIILQQAPGLAQDLVNGLNAVEGWNIDTGDLKQLASDGQLTADRIVNAFGAAADDIEAKFDRMPTLWSQNVTKMQNAWTLLLATLGQTDGPLDIINTKFGEFIDRLISLDEGAVILNNLYTIITLISVALGAVMDLFFWGIELVLENLNVLIAVVLVLGAVLTVNLVKAIAMFVIMNWQILLIIAAVAAVIWVFSLFGITVGDVLGFIVGGIFWLIGVIINIVVVIAAVAAGIIAIVIDLVLFIVELIIYVVTTIVAIVVTLVTAVLNVAGAILKVIIALGSGIVEIFLGVVVGVVTLFQGLAFGVLSVLELLAKAIDFIFGSNLSGVVGGWIDNVNSLADNVRGGLYTAIEDVFEYNVDLWTNPDNWIDSAGVFDTIWGFGDDIGQWIAQGFQNPQDWVDGVIDWGWLDSQMLGDMFNAGNALGQGWGNSLEELLNGFDFGDMDLDAILNGIGNADLNIGGGDLDSIGKIKSDVNIADEDLKLLRDVAAREWLLQLATVTPQMTVQFGDVRETADVENIMDALADMMEEALATSLVYD